MGGYGIRPYKADVRQVVISRYSFLITHCFQDLELLHRILRGEVAAKSPGMKAKVAAIRKAAGEATASVMEHALRRGSGANMHMLYLKSHAGYDSDKGGKAARDEGGERVPPVIFLGEEDIPD